MTRKIARIAVLVIPSLIFCSLAALAFVAPGPQDARASDVPALYGP